MASSVSDYPCEVCGVKFTLRVTPEVFATVERRADMSAAALLHRINSGAPRITDVSEMFAAMALPHGKHTAAAVRAIMPVRYGKTLLEMCEHMDKALSAAMPPEDAEASGEGGAAEAGKVPTS